MTPEMYGKGLANVSDLWGTLPDPVPIARRSVVGYGEYSGLELRRLLELGATVAIYGRVSVRPGIVQQFHPAQFLEHDATPILRRPDRPQSAFALAAILIAEHARFAQTIAAQPVRAKQPRELLVDGSDRLPVRHRHPNQPVHVLHRLDLCLDNSSQLHDTAGALSLYLSTIYNTVVAS